MRVTRDIWLAVRRGPSFLADALMAIWQLALANQALRRTLPGELPLLPAAQLRSEATRLSLSQAALVKRVAYVVPRMGFRVPWRSDCLVQALAARRWLAHAAVHSEIHIGVRNDEQGFQAHAWLKAGEQIVTGGDISSYAELPPAQIGRTPFTP